MLLSQTRHLSLILVVLTFLYFIEFFISQGFDEKLGTPERFFTRASDCAEVANRLPKLLITGTMKSGSGALMELLQGYSNKKAKSWLNKWSWGILDAHPVVSVTRSGNHRFVAGTGIKPVFNLGDSNNVRSSMREVHYFGLNYESHSVISSDNNAHEASSPASLVLDVSSSDGNEDARCGGKYNEKIVYANHFAAVVDSRVNMHTEKQSLPVVYFDKSPDYIRSPRKLAQIQELVPHAKHVILLRDAVDRLYSEFQHHCRHGRYILIPTETETSRPVDKQTLPDLHAEMVHYLTHQLGWRDTLWWKMRPNEWFQRANVVQYPGAPELFHAYITQSPVMHKGVPHIVKKVLGYRDIEEILLSMFFTSEGETQLARRQQRRQEILLQWQSLMSGRPSLHSPFTFPQFQQDGAKSIRRGSSRSSRTSQLHQWTLMVGPENDLVHSNYSYQLEAAFTSLSGGSHGDNNTAGGGSLLRQRLLIIDQSNMLERSGRGTGGQQEIVRDIERLLAEEAEPSLTAVQVESRYSLLLCSPRNPQSDINDSVVGITSSDKYQPMLPESRQFLCSYYVADNRRTMALLKRFHS